MSLSDDKPKQNPDDGTHVLWTAVILLLCLVLFILVYLLITDIRASHSRLPLVPRRPPHGFFNLFSPNRAAPTTTTDINNIQTWMTFDYLNKTFKLPPSLLQTQLGITDQRYPDISIRHFTAETRRNSDQVLKQIQQSISGQASVTATHL